MLSITITCKNKDEAQKIADILLRRKLIACSNHVPVSSAYWWKGKKEMNNEVLMVVKTLDGKFKDIVSEIRKIHSYEVPLISAREEETTKEVEKWLHEVIS